MMKIAEQQAGDVTVIVVDGQVDSNSAKTFEEKLTTLFTSGPKRVIVDFKHLALFADAFAQTCGERVQRGGLRRDSAPERGRWPQPG